MPKCRVVRSHCRKSASGRRRRPCVKSDGSAGNQVRTYVVPKGCVPDALRTIQRAERRRRSRVASPPPPSPTTKRVRFDASAQKRDTPSCVRLPVTDPRFRSLFKTSVPMFAYLQNVFRESVQQRRDAFVVDNGLEEYARARAGTSHEYVIASSRVVDPSAPGLHYCLVPRASRTRRQRIQDALDHLDDFANDDVLRSFHATRRLARTEPDDAPAVAESSDPTGTRAAVQWYVGALQSALKSV